VRGRRRCIERQVAAGELSLLGSVFKHCEGESSLGDLRHVVHSRVSATFPCSLVTLRGLARSQTQARRPPAPHPPYPRRFFHASYTPPGERSEKGR
jgi:hypothetical protein